MSIKFSSLLKDRRVRIVTCTAALYLMVAAIGLHVQNDSTVADRRTEGVRTKPAADSAQVGNVLTRKIELAPFGDDVFGILIAPFHRADGNAKPPANDPRESFADALRAGLAEMNIGFARVAIIPAGLGQDIESTRAAAKFGRDYRAGLVIRGEIDASGLIPHVIVVENGPASASRAITVDAAPLREPLNRLTLAGQAEIRLPSWNGNPSLVGEIAAAFGCRTWNDLDGALRHFEAALLQFDQVNVGGNISRAPFPINLGDILLGQKKYREAVGRYSEALHADPRQAAALNNRGVALLAQGRPEEALSDFNAALDIDPGLVPALRNRGSLYHGQGKHDEAMADYNRIIEINPLLAEVHNELGSMHLHAEQYAKALNDFSRALSLEPAGQNRWLYFYNRALTYLEMEEFQKALSDLDDSIRLNPGSVEGYFYRGTAQALSGNAEKAKADYRKVLETEPRDTRQLEARGSLHMGRSEFREAVYFFTLALEVDANRAQTWLYRGISYLALAKFEPAIRDFTKTIELDGTSADAYFNRGLAYGRIYQNEQAIQDFDQAIAISPRYSLAYLNRGNLYFSKNEIRLAIDDYTRMIEVDAADYEAWHRRGNAYLRVEDYDRAIRDYTKCLEINPTILQSYNNRGRAYIWKANYDLAEKDFRRSIEIDPTYFYAYLGLGDLYRLRKQDDQAIEMYRLAIKHNPSLVSGPLSPVKYYPVLSK